MKRIMLFLVLGVFVLAACAQQEVANPNADDAEADDTLNADNTGNTNTEDSAATGEVKEFRIEAKQFEFVPSTIEVNKGDTVRLIVTSTDVPHGFSIPEYGINERLEPNNPVTIEFVADKQGTFTAFCSVACGSGHRSMKGSLIVR